MPSVTNVTKNVYNWDSSLSNGNESENTRKWNHFSTSVVNEEKWSVL